MSMSQETPNLVFGIGFVILGILGLSLGVAMISRWLLK